MTKTVDELMRHDAMGRRINHASHAHLRKHGGLLEHRKTYQCWQDMKQRCLNSKHKQFKNYGARGISVCDRWMSDFSSFLQDMGDKPNGLTLDRIDNDGPYEPSNCRWATPAQQRANQRGVCLLPVNGEMVPRDVAARLVGLHPATLQTRLRIGWSVDDALTTPARGKPAMQQAPEQEG